MIDGSTNRFKSYIRNGTGRSRGEIEINAATNTIYAMCFDSNVLTVIDGISGSLTAKIEVGKDHRGIAIDPISKKIFVANSGSNSISVVDEQSNKVVDTIKIELDSGAAGKIPKFIIADPSMKQLYVQYCEILRAEGMAIFATSLLVIDTIKKTTVSKRQLYVNLATSPTDGLAFAFNNNTKVLYTSRKASNTVLMLDTYGKKVLKKIVLEKGKIWKNFVSHIISIAEPIARDTKTKSIRDRQQQESII
jgi:YVTN family beta-propeller protein